jgi:signal transduction histidine kinase
MNGWSDPDRRQQGRDRWLAADAGLAVLFAWITVASLRSDAYIDEYGAVQGAGWLLALAPNALLLFRRYVPVITLVTATLLYLAASATQGDSNAPLAIPFFAYSVAFTRRVPISATIVGAAALTLCTTTFYGPGDPDPLVIVVLLLLFGAGWLVAVSIRGEQARAEHLTESLDELQAHQDDVAAAAAFDERSRIARELHDAVGHAVNVMVLQAGAARLSQQPDKAFGALREIEGLGRSALTDLDHMLGLLNDSGAPVRGPAQNIADIATMVAEMQAAGADITLRNDCEVPVGPRPSDPA